MKHFIFNAQKIILIFVLFFSSTSVVFSQAQYDLFVYSSTDGTTFGLPTFLTDSADVPSITQDSSGRLVCMFQSFKGGPSSSTWDKIGVKFSNDNGLTWTSTSLINISGLPGTTLRPFDPTIVMTEDHKYRLFFSYNPYSTLGDSTTDTYSATSVDAINFVLDTGIRVDLLNYGIIDPAVVYFDSLWHYSAPLVANYGAKYATSTDGLYFTMQSDIASGSSHYNWTGNLVNDGSSMRFYGATDNATGDLLWWSESTNGSVWSSYNLTNVTGKDPGIVKTASNTYFLVVPQEPSTVISDKTWTGATSSDWSEASNWTPSGVPDITDNVVINSPIIQPFISSNVIVNNLNIDNATLTIGDSDTLTINGDLSVGTNTAVPSIDTCTIQSVANAVTKPVIDVQGNLYVGHNDPQKSAQSGFGTAFLIVAVVLLVTLAAFAISAAVFSSDSDESYTTSSMVSSQYNLTAGATSQVSGSYDATDSEIELDENSSLTVGGNVDLQNSPVTVTNIMDGPSAHFVMDGTNQQFLSTDGPIYNMTVTNPNGVVGLTPLEITGFFTLSTNAMFMSSFGITLIANENGTGSFYQETNSVLSIASLTQEVYAGQNGYHFFSSGFDPFGTISGNWTGLPALNKMYLFNVTLSSVNDPASGWVNPTSTQPLGSNALAVKVENAPQTFSYTSYPSFPFNGIIDIDVLGVGCEWNYINNPWAFSLHADYLDYPSASSSAIFIWDPLGEYYRSWVNGVGQNGATAEIPVGGGFFTNDIGIMQFDNTQAPFFMYSARQNQSNPIFRLLFSGQGAQTEAVFTYRQGATEDYDRSYDAVLFPAGNASTVELASQSADGENLVINSLPPENLYSTIPLYNTPGTDGDYSIVLTQFDNFSSGDEVILHDLTLGVTKDLTQGPYTYAALTTDSKNRFEISTYPYDVSLEQPQENSGDLVAYQSNGELVLVFKSNTTEQTSLNVYNLLGRKMLSQVLYPGKETYTLNTKQIPLSGVYVVNVEGYRPQIVRY